MTPHSSSSTTLLIRAHRQEAAKLTFAEATDILAYAFQQNDIDFVEEESDNDDDFKPSTFNPPARRGIADDNVIAPDDAPLHNSSDEEEDADGDAAAKPDVNALLAVELNEDAVATCSTIRSDWLKSCKLETVPEKRLIRCCGLLSFWGTAAYFFATSSPIRQTLSD
jgi:hypothetical protein